ncbi:haloacid dehalogenase-like hydrolase [Oesophagostomum dentatum]|uniref:Haloacid dehalogenase-like hydrolase n=1 Tax=Oesophagostomum dentatum TaxID=61180 RepID=A0A0B1TUN0_OESDE|nr:haloacid dehalogenase-like hydrolase [Oesophagostomum dentatum]
MFLINCSVVTFLCLFSKIVQPGLLAEGTMAQIKHEIQRLLIRNGFGGAREFDVLEKCIQNSQSQSSANLRAIHDMHLLFNALKENDIKIAVCTADNRANTISMLRCFNVEELVDIAVCGDDPGSKPKPHPHNANFICETLGVDPENAVMVGDTLADLGMARAAGLGAAVGVLSGVGAVDHLESHADILVPHVGSLLTIFLGIDEFNKKS